MTAKHYRGRRITQHTNTIIVVTFSDGGISTAPLEHVVYHSPTGMEWGYGGSGPADTALSILADFFDETAAAIKRSQSAWGARPTLAFALHHAFKSAFVARWGAEWLCESDAIQLWLDEPALAATIVATRERQAEFDDEADEAIVRRHNGGAEQ